MNLSETAKESLNVSVGGPAKLSRDSPLTARKNSARGDCGAVRDTLDRVPLLDGRSVRLPDELTLVSHLYRYPTRKMARKMALLCQPFEIILNPKIFFRRLTMSYLRILLTLPFVSASLLAQTNEGQITGTVFDATKAVMDGVKISAANLATNVTQTATSNKDGVYSLPALQPGTYSVTLEKTGFKKLVRQPITVEGGTTVQLDFDMVVGSTASEVTITADVPVIQTGTSTIQYGLDLKQIDELPVTNQSAVQILGLLPGVQGGMGSEQAAITTGLTTPGAGLSISGSAQGTVQFQADGVSNTSLYYGRIALALSTDAVAEVSVVQNSYSAEYRSGGGAVVSMTTKSGTNQYHGTMFSFSQNDILNAAPWERYRAKGEIRYWRGGIDVGGPVAIPKLYNGRNKTFFFANYEPLRQFTQSQYFDRMATTLERQGDFSKSVYNNITNQPIEIFQHFNPGANKQIVEPANTAYPQFPNNTIPTSLISPTGQKILDQEPLPNMPINGLGENYAVFRSVRNTDNRYLFRIDEVVTNNNRLSFRFAQVPTHGVRFNQGGYIEEVPTDNNTGTNAMLSDTYTWGGNKVNEFRYGFNRSNNSRTQDPLELSVNGYKMFNFPSFLTKGVPLLNGFDANVQSFGVDPGVFEIDNFFEMSDTLSWVKGKHSLKIGADWQAPEQNIVDFGNVGGTWAFNASGTNIGAGNTNTVLGIPNATTGTSFATLLLGYPTGVTIAPAVIPYQYRWKYWAFFLQDDWKITGKLTLNIGLRYQIEVPRSEKHHMQGEFVDQPITLPTGAQQQGYVQLAGLGGAPNTLWPTRYNNWEPRFGFAYRLPALIPGLQVMRGAYAINHVPTSGLFTSAYPDLSPKSAQYATNGAANGGQVQMDFAPLVLPTGGLQIPSDGKFTNITNANTLSYFNPHVTIPYVQQWNFGFGFQFGASMGMEVNYVGNKSTNMFGPSAIYNEVNLPQYTQEFNGGLNMSQSIPNPQGIVGANGQVINVTRTNSLRPLSTLGDITNPTSQGFDARYNALQINYSKRFSLGFQFNVNYVWMKAMDDVSCSGSYCTVVCCLQNWGVGEPQLFGDSHSLEKSISTYDIPSDFRLNYNWDIPVGKGKKFFNVQRGWINQIVGNWKTSGNLEERSGLPFSVVAGTGTFAGYPDGVANLRPNVVPGVNPILPNWKAGCDNPITQTCPYVNSLAYYRPPTELGVGNATRVEDAVRMPHVQTYNMAILKEIPLHERIKLAFRAELYGALNHVSFSTNQNDFTLYTGLSYVNTPNPVPTSANIVAAFASVRDNMGGQRTIQLGLKLYF